jgi:hypothetical protein
MSELKDLQYGPLRSAKKNSVIKDVAFITQLVNGQLVTFQLVPPRNMKITNKAASHYSRRKGSK